jgi:hypothetical protein
MQEWRPDWLTDLVTKKAKERKIDRENEIEREREW